MGYKITPIDGDLVVGRNAEVGGNMDIHGNARVAGSLKVEGFLDAPHIKGAAKGLFNSVEELTREYPNPRPGWFAIVLDATNKEMGILYKAENRGWVATTDEARPYEFIMDSINVFASKDEVAEITAEVSKALDEKVDKSSIVHTTGDSAEKVMSQESISKSIVANASVFKTFDSSVQMADIALAFIKDIRIYTDTPKEISLFLLSRNGNDYKMQFAYTDEAEGVYYMQYNGPINDDCCVISGNGFLAHIYVNKNALPDGVQVSNMGRKAFVLSSSCFFTNDRLLGLDAKVAENTQKIDELKDCFTVDTVVEDFSVEKDTYIDYYNGATKSFEGYELRKYPVEEGTTISVCVEGVTFDAAAAMYAIYSDDSVMDETTLLNLGPALSPANNGKHTLNLPAGSRMLALSVWKKDTTAAYSVSESRNSVEGFIDSRVNKIIEEEEINTRIDESLGSVTFSLTEGGVYIDQWDNKGNAKGEPTRIPTADTGGMGFMSKGDKTYLDSLNNEGTLEDIQFTQSNQSFRLSVEGYNDIPKGVHIQIQSDTITELIGWYLGIDGKMKPQTLKDGTITEGVISIIENKDEIGDVTIKYTGQIAELLSRLQGMSEESSASTDPFRFLGEFKSPIKNEDGDLHEALDNLHSKNKADGYEGVWRFNVQGKPSTLYNLALNYNKDRWLQGLITIYSPSSNPNNVFSLNNKINILYRIHELDENENGKWSTWRSITQDNTDAIVAETARAKKAEEELRQTAVTKKRNYIHATSDEAYVISKYNNKYDIIIHFAKTLANNLYTIESVYLVNNTNTELSTDINREPVYRFCQQQTSDMIGPVSVRTGIDGLSWVGGNHFHKTQDSDVKTAETETFIVNADDTTIGNGRMYAEKITIRVKNKIYDPNVEPVSGAKILSSKLIDEFVTYTIDGGEVLVSVEHRYVKDIYVGAYYGMQSMFTQYSQIITNTLTDWKDKVDKDSSYSIPKGDVIDFNRFSQKHLKNNEEVFYQNTILLPYGIGKHQLVKDGAQVFVEAGSKAYHVLIKQQDIKANDVLSWMGVYSWKKPIIDNEYNYIYSYSDNNGENISVTAKQVYENKIVPVSPSLANKVYESDGIVKVDDIIGYNIVLSADNVGSSIIRVDNGIRVASTENDGLMSAEDKSKLINFAERGEFYDLNTYTSSGVYLINTASNEAKNYPIQTPANSLLRLTVIDSYDGNNHVITQVVNINNHVGGEGNVYIRSNQNQEWKPWAKLQTNVEVGLIDQAKMDDLTDNGIYSGILSTTGETFVIICINNYAIAQQVGVQHISHLKYSLVVGTGEVKIEKRTRDAYGIWTDWENIGSGSSISEATTETAGAVKLGKSNGNEWYAIGNIGNPVHGSGLGLKIDSSIFVNSVFGLSLNLDNTGGLSKNSGLAINLGTTLSGDHNAIPLCIGTPANIEKLIEWTRKSTPGGEVPSIPVNPDQFKLGNYGLELTNTSSTTKITWNSSSNMNDFKTPGVYEIYGERTVKTDNLPIANDGSGHSISARLTVVASTLQPANNEICITQFLMLSNRLGGDGNMYVRTYNQNNGGVTDGVWSPWQKQMGLVETLINSDYATVGQEIFSAGSAQKIGDGLNGMIDNGMYSGIYIDNLGPSTIGTEYCELSAQPTFVETFVLVVINDYAASGNLKLPRHITQLKYAVDAITGQSTVKKRVGTGNDNISWGDWKDIGGGGSNEVDITDAVNDYGLYTLYSQGFMKDNVVYKYQQSGGELPQFDNSDKIRPFLISKGYENRSTAITIMIRKFNSIITLDVDMCANLSLGGDNALNHYKFITSSLSSVKVSADMTVLNMTE